MSGVEQVELIRGYLLGQNAPAEILAALDVLKRRWQGKNPNASACTYDGIAALPVDVLLENIGGKIAARIRNVFVESFEITRIGDVSTLSRNQLLKYPNVGVKCVNEIEAALKSLGLELARE